MSYGLNIYSDNGKIAFSTDYRNYRLHSKVTSTLNWVQSGNSNIRAAEGTVNFGTVVMPSDCVMVHSISNIGTTWTIRFVSYYSSTQYFSGNTGVTITAYIFTADHTPQSSGYGINIYNSSGDCVFSGQDRALQISSFVVLPSGSTVKTNIPVTTGSIPTSWALSAGNIGVTAISGGPTSALIFPLGLCRASSSEVYIGPSARYLAVINIGGGTPPDFVQPYQYCMAIDTSLYD